MGGTFTVRGHCSFAWRIDDLSQARVILIARQCDACVRSMRIAAQVAGCRMSDDPTYPAGPPL